MFMITIVLTLLVTQFLMVLYSIIFFYAIKVTLNFSLQKILMVICYLKNLIIIKVYLFEKLK